ncbi:MAG: ribonuclease III [Spirochaetales bacterium]|nr:ribonuclease III [Spirochaetales bacterium]
MSKDLPFRAPVVGAERRKELHLFQRHAHVRFRSLEFLNLAFSHRSYANEQGGAVDNNEKLEFFGDSVLGLVVSEHLVLALPDRSEGDLAKIKSFVVSEDSLSEIARRVRLDNFILIGKGEEYSGGRSKKAIMADALEAVIGAYYLDSGFKAVRSFIRELLIPEIEKVLADQHKKDYKTLLQEYVQKRFKSYPHYRVVQRKGPDHNKTFWIEVSVGKKTYGPGSGKNKKEAEQEAASIAYRALVPDAEGEGGSRS